MRINDFWCLEISQSQIFPKNQKSEIKKLSEINFLLKFSARNQTVEGNFNSSPRILFSDSSNGI
jgi:hypothetical protein